MGGTLPAILEEEEEGGSTEGLAPSSLSSSGMQD